MICGKVIHNSTFDFDHENDVVDYSTLIIMDLLNAYCLSATVLRIVHAYLMQPTITPINQNWG